jgi:hypothetical protein
VPLRSHDAPVYSIKGAIAGRPNLRYFDPLRNNMRFSPTGGGLCVIQSILLRESDRSISSAIWNVYD